MASKQILKNANGVDAEITLINPDTNTTRKTVDVSNIQHKVDTIASLRALTELHETVWVSGYHTANDGAFGSHFFRWNSTSTEDDNGGTIIKLDGVETGRYELQYDGAVNVKWFGAVGDESLYGVAGRPDNDTEAIQNALDFCYGNGVSLSANNMSILVSNTIHIANNIEFSNTTIYPTTSFSDSVVIDIELGAKIIEGLRVSGNEAVKSSGIIGIKVGNPSSILYSSIPYEITMYDLLVSSFDVGLELSTYQCNFYNMLITSCNTGLSMYGINNGQEINLNSFFGGQIRNCDDYALYLGDTRNPDCRSDLAQQGHTNAFYNTQIIGTASVGYVSNTLLSAIDFEDAGYGNGKALYVHGEVKVLSIDTPFFNGYDYAMYIAGDVNKPNEIIVKEPTYNNITYCGLYTTSDLTTVRYTTGRNISSFSNGAEFHFASRHNVTNNYNNIKLLISDICNTGVQNINDDYLILNNQAIVDGYSNFRFLLTSGLYKTTQVTISGTLSGYVFTADNPADVYGLLPGTYMRKDTSGSQAGTIDSIDYENGIIRLGSGFYAASALAISLYSYKPTRLETTYLSSAPTTGDWLVGDTVYNKAPTAGGNIGWVCTTAGSPGTWKTFGTISA